MKVGSFEVSEKLYESENSLVYRAMKQSQNPCVILKILKENYPTREELARFHHEFALIRSLQGKNIIRAIGLEVYNKMLVLVLEDIDGDALGNWLQRTTVTLREGLQISIEICQGLGEIHGQRVIHKDINTSNIIWNRQAGVVKIIDFGIASRLERTQAFPNTPRMLEGKLPYMSPEQTGRMNRPLDYRSDFYSLGVTLYELFSGKKPFESDDPLEMIHFHIAKRPLALDKQKPSIPAMLSNIVLKLMEKSAEDRYRSAEGIKEDLSECLRQIEASGHIALFPVGLSDISDRFQLPSKLYGRDQEAAALASAFNAACAGNTVLTLVTGHSGVGKSCLVQELYRPLAVAKGLYLSGKYDQFRRNVPYSALGQTFNALCDQLLSESNEHLEHWRQRILAGIGNNGQVLIGVFSRLELLIGSQPPVAEVDLQAAQNRFIQVFQNFVQVICSPEKPLVLFLDDLQWADSGSISLLQTLLSRSDIRGLHVVGAYRDNEVESTHPLHLMLNEITKAGRLYTTIHLGNLSYESVVALAADTLSVSQSEVGSLAKIICSKTEGNAFFTTEFLKALYTEALLTFNRAYKKWQWDVDSIQTRDITDNVVELMVDKIKALPESTQEILKLAACVGNQFDLSTLSVISENATHVSVALDQLMPAIQQGITIPQNENYKNIGFIDDEAKNSSFKFQHDRVQQAAYSLIPKAYRPKIHQKIARLLLGGCVGAAALEEILFDVVNHLNKGLVLIEGSDERVSVASLNLKAGLKARSASAYLSSMDYFIVAKNLLPEGSFDRNYSLAFEIYLGLTKSLYTNGRFAEAEKLYPVILEHTASTLDRVHVHMVQMEDYHLQGKYESAILVQAQALALLGSQVPTSDQDFTLAIEVELENVRRLLGRRQIADLVDAPEISSPEIHASLKILMGMWMSSYLISKELMVQWSSVRMTNICLEYGSSDIAAFAFVQYGYLCIGRLRQFDQGYDYGQLALRLSDRYNNQELRGKVYFMFGLCINHWTKHISLSTESFRKGYLCSVESGDWTYAVYGAANIISNLIIAGAPCEEIETEANNYLEFLEGKASVGLKSFFLPGGFCALLNLLGKTVSNNSFNCEYLNEERFLGTLGQLPIVEGWFYAVKIRSLYHYRCFEEGLKVVAKADVVAVGVPGQIKIPEAYFYSCLMIASACHLADDCNAKEHYLGLFKKYESQIELWASHCPENYQHKYYLILAEKSRFDGGDIGDTLALYDQAIQSAKEHKYLNNEALSYELKGRFWLEKGCFEYALSDLREAHHRYRLWGATGKVAALEAEFQELSNKKTSSLLLTSQCSSSFKVGQLDLLSIFKATRAISGEIVLPELLNKLIRIVMEYSGAQKGVLLNIKDGKLSTGIEANINSGDEIQINHHVSLRLNPLPEAIVNYVKRSHEKVLLDDASLPNIYSTDNYIVAHKPKSVLCLPLLNQGKLAGMIYLENNLVGGAFTDDHLAVLELLLGQIVISLENAVLFDALKDNERQFRTLVDSMPQLAWMAKADGYISWYNQGWYTYTGTTPEQSEGWGWQSVHDPSELPRVLALWTECIRTGSPFELEFPLRGCDGNFRWFLTRAAPVRNAQGELIHWFGTNTDIEDQRRATSERERIEHERHALRANEQAAIEASKLKSDFLANMSHEIRTPINGVIGMTGLLADTQLNVEQRSYLDAVKRSADSLLTVINDILDFSKIEAGKLDFETIDFDLLSVISDTEATMGFSAQNKGLTLVAEIAHDLPRFLKGDPGRLRQILNNLINNAIKFTAHGFVKIRCTQTGMSQNMRHLRFEIEDSGIGIASSALPKMFNAFSQADSSTSRRFGGSGLGLSICKNLVEKMDGQIGVVSQEGFGSTFWFTVAMPLGSSSGIARVNHPTLELLPELTTSWRILVAEDNAVNQVIAVKMLQKMGYRADAVANGREAINALRDIAYDLVLMDCQMPEMDGYEATTFIRNSDSLGRKSIPVLALTANAMKGDQEKCIAAGMNDYISKPIDKVALRNVLEKWLPNAREANGGVAAPVLTMQEFVSTLPARVALMKRAAQDRNLKLLTGEAHSIKDAGASLGATRLAEVCQKIENLSALDDADALAALLSQAEGECSLVVEELGRNLGGNENRVA